MSEYIDIYIDTTTKVPEDATEFDYELFERFMSGGPWVAHSEYMKLKADNAELRECLQDLAEHIREDDGFGLDYGWMLDRMRELDMGEVEQ